MGVRTATSVEVPGHVKCLNLACDVDTRPVLLRKDTVSESGEPGVFARMTVTASDHHSPVNETDLRCLSCGHPVAILTQPERDIPKYI